VTKPALIPIEGPEKATRGGEWEPIKIPRGNLAYIPKSIWHASLIAQPRPPSYKKVIGPQNQVRQTRNTAKYNNRCNQGHVRDFGSQNQTNKAIYCLSHISSNTLRAYSRNHYRSAMRTRKPQALDPAAQEQDWNGAMVTCSRRKYKSRRENLPLELSPLPRSGPSGALLASWRHRKKNKSWIQGLLPSPTDQIRAGFLAGARSPASRTERPRSNTKLGRWMQNQTRVTKGAKGLKARSRPAATVNEMRSQQKSGPIDRDKELRNKNWQ
jgi:hypothetical protein